MTDIYFLHTLSPSKANNSLMVTIFVKSNDAFHSHKVCILHAVKHDIAHVFICILKILKCFVTACKQIDTYIQLSAFEMDGDPLQKPFI